MSDAARRIDDLCLALETVVDAGEDVALAFGSEMDVRLKSPEQPVTQTDLEVDAALRERLLGERPDYGWLSEESRDDARRLDCESVWIVDSIDGTSSFVAGIPDSVVSVGLVEGRTGIAVVGVIFNPLTGELYWAVRGGGAYGVLVETARHVDVGPPLDALVHVPSVEYIGPGGWGRYMIVHDVRSAPEPPLRAFLSRADEGDVAGILPPGWVAVPRGSTAYKMAGVASGVADAYFADGAKSEWDLCAASLLVEEAGGRVSDLNGEELRFNRPETGRSGIVCASDATIHAQLVAWLRAGWREGVPAGKSGPSGESTASA